MKNYNTLNYTIVNIRVMTLVLITSVLSYSIGQMVSYREKTHLRTELNESYLLVEKMGNRLDENEKKINSLGLVLMDKDSIICKYQDTLSSPEWRKYLIYQESGIVIPKHVPDKHVKLMVEQADKYNIPKRILFRLIAKESKYGKQSENICTGAHGYMQVMPATLSFISHKLKLKGGNTPENNIKVGTYLLANMYSIVKHKVPTENMRWQLAVAGYNAGIKKVMDANYRMPHIKETRELVNFVVNG